MNSPTRRSLIGSVLACGAAISPAIHAGGIGLYEIATPDVGLASAGYAARAQDASTVFKNPAGMSLLEGSQFQGGLQLTYGSVEFSKDADTDPLLGDQNGGNAIGALPAGGLFYTRALSERFAVEGSTPLSPVAGSPGPAGAGAGRGNRLHPAGPTDSGQVCAVDREAFRGAPGAGHSRRPIAAQGRDDDRGSLTSPLFQPPASIGAGAW
ncbi:MAG: outer membrane protein transport protein [Verrucomicrobia bacterium]|nr:outer membrane protein transport protein [Verrucomicrobiota bacterium]